MPDPLVIARSGDIELALLPAVANRHGLVTGATGTGKTVSLQVMAERMSSSSNLDFARLQSATSCRSLHHHKQPTPPKRG